MSLEFANLFLSILTVIGQAMVVILLGAWIFAPKGSLVKFVGENRVVMSFIVALIAMSGSLYYSEIAGLEPCELCWFQRIAMYPLVMLLAIALIKKDEGVAKYSLGLAVPGIIIGIYHYYLQLGGVGFTSCGVVGYSINCADKFVLKFGYITIPLMAVTAFAMIIVFMLSRKKTL